MSLDKIIENIEELKEIPAVSSRTSALTEAIADKANQTGRNVEVGEEGSVIVRNKEKGSDKTISAHIDRIGLLPFQGKIAEYAPNQIKRKNKIPINTSKEKVREYAENLIN